MLQLNSFLLSALLMCTCLGAFAQETTPPAESTPTRDPSPYANTYFLSASAFQMPRGRFEFTSRALVLNNLSYGVTNYLTVTGGLSLLPIFNDESQYWAGVRLGAPLSEKIRVGASFTSLYTSFSGPELIESMPSSDRFNNEGLSFDDNTSAFNYAEIYATIGIPLKNFTLGIGVAESGGIISQPVISIAASYPVSPRMAVLLDGKIGNRIPTYATNNASYLRINQQAAVGIRLAGKAHVFDIGAAFQGRPGDSFVYPYFAFRKQF